MVIWNIRIPNLINFETSVASVTNVSVCLCSAPWKRRLFFHSLDGEIANKTKLILLLWGFEKLEKSTTIHEKNSNIFIKFKKNLGLVIFFILIIQLSPFSSEYWPIAGQKFNILKILAWLLFRCETSTSSSESTMKLILIKVSLLFNLPILHPHPPLFCLFVCCMCSLGCSSTRFSISSTRDSSSCVRQL